MSIHTEPSEYAGVTFDIDIPGVGVGDFTVEDWWDRVNPKPWALADGNPAALKFAMRAGLNGVFADGGIPDNEVVYGKLRGIGHIVHVTELADLAPVVSA